MKRIAFFVMIFHGLLLLNFFFFKSKEIKPDSKKLTVHQYYVAPKQEVKKVAPAPKLAASPLPVKKAATKVKQPPTPAPKPVKAVKKTSPPPAQQTKSPPSAPPITHELIKELQESIAKIEGSHDKVDTAKPINTPIAIETLRIDTPNENMSVQENYTRTLITCLQGSLNLPDFGEVTIELTLKQDGSVAKLVVLKTESANNRRYLEMHLPHVKFPVLNKPEHTFVLTFCNEV